MPGKNTIQRRIDKPSEHSGGAAIEAATPSLAPPAPKSIPEPEDLALTSGLARAAATPTAYIAATWSRPSGSNPQSYVIQISADNAFPDGQTQTFTAQTESATLDGLKTATTYYVRVAAVYRSIQSPWSDQVSETTPSDTTPAAQPTDLAAAWIGIGDLSLTWTNPSDENFRDVEIRIYTSSGGTLLRTIYSAVGRFVYTTAMNLADTSGTGDPSLYVTARSRTWGGVINNSSVPTVSPTKSVPSAPSLAHSWSGDGGTAGADLTLSWSTISDAAMYRLSLNGGTAISLNATSHTYTLAANIAQNGSADPSVTYSLVAVDGLGQQSTAVSGTATNAAPATTSIAVTAGFSAIAVGATPSTAADLYEYLFRIIKDSSTVTTYHSSSPDQIYKVSGKGSYEVGVRVVDAFGQESSETVSSAIALDPVTNEEIREDAAYSDSISTDFSSEPNKSILKNDAVGAGITYTASASAWRWTQLERTLIQRGRRVSVRLGSGSANFYIGVSLDGTTWSWFAGVGGDGMTLTARANEATAQSNAALASALTYGYAELPATVEYRYIRLGHRNTTSSYRLDEFYGYTLVIADMIRAGSIATNHLGAGAVTADKISVLTLAAIQANIGSAHIDNWLTIGLSGGIYQGTGTPETPTTGLKIWNDSGIGKLATYNAGVQQITIDTDGKLKAGGGVNLDQYGVWVKENYNLLFTPTAGPTSAIWARIGVTPSFFNIVSSKPITIETISGDVIINSAGVLQTYSGIRMGYVAGSVAPGSIWGNGYVRMGNTSGTPSGGDIWAAGVVRADDSIRADKIHANSATRTIIDGITDLWLRLNPSSHYTNGIYTPGHLRAEGGLSTGVPGTPPIVGAGNIGYAGRLQSYANSTLYDVFGMAVLTAPLTAAAWTASTRSTTAKTVIDLSAVFGAPAGIKAALVRVAVSDSGAGANDAHIILGPNASSGVGIGVSCPPANSRPQRTEVIVPCDGNGDFYFQIVASGTNTFTVTLEIWGYWI